jgi:hypothetical protein
MDTSVSARVFGDRELHRDRRAGSHERGRERSSDRVGAKCSEDVARIGDCFVAECDDEVAEQHAGAIGGRIGLDGDDEKSDARHFTADRS